MSLSRHALHGTCRLALAAALWGSGLGCEADDSGGGGSGGAAPAPTEIAIDSGTVQGSVSGETRAFLGLPYAAPPVGDLRWRSPQPVTPWTSPRDATVDGPACPQALGQVSDVSEDCLTLDVWTPAHEPSAPLPVMVWIHGGAFVAGSGGMGLYNGQKLSEAGDVVVVTINYRLASLGFLRHPPLTAEDIDHPTSGMYGIEDQIAALQWVQRNIAAFGGDPANVTVFGESAGGISVCLHLLLPESRGLFHRAIIESGPCNLMPLASADEADAQGAALAVAVGCDDGPGDELACLRGKTPEELRDALAKPGTPPPGGMFYGAWWNAFWWPHVDGLVLPKPPETLLADGSFSKVPVVIGTMADEGAIFLDKFLGATPIATKEEYEAALGRTFAPEDVPAILAMYPAADFDSPNAAAAAVAGDAYFICPTRTAARALSARDVPTFLYNFEGVASSGLVAALGPTHAVDTLFVFGNDWPVVATVGEAGQPLVRDVQRYWTQLARNGDPNGDEGVAWPAFDEATDQHLVLNVPVTAASGLRRAQCDFWDGVPRTAPAPF